MWRASRGWMLAALGFQTHAKAVKSGWPTAGGAREAVARAGSAGVRGEGRGRSKRVKSRAGGSVREGEERETGRPDWWVREVSVSRRTEGVAAELGWRSGHVRRSKLGRTRVIGPVVRRSVSWAGSSGLGRRSCSRGELGRRACVLAGWQAGLRVGQAGWLAGLCGFVSWAGLRV